ncbi:MAG: leucine-rich repeat protein [Firmicutes bacterium]|nr:leucine-rich repeat protein [Bacillota bacterium]
MKKKEYVEYTLRFHLKNGKTIEFVRKVESFSFFKNKWRNDGECITSFKELQSLDILPALWNHQTIDLPSKACLKGISVQAEYVKETEYTQIYVYDIEKNSYSYYTYGEKNPQCWYDNLQLQEECQLVEKNPLPVSKTSISTITDYLYEGNVETLDANDCVIPGTVKYIEKGSFSSFNKMKSIYIPESVEYIDENAFSTCYWIEEVKSDNERYTVRENRLFDSRTNVYLTYGKEKNAKLLISVNDIKILNSLKTLEEYNIHFDIDQQDLYIEFPCQFEKNNGRVQSASLFKSILSLLRKKCVVLLQVQNMNKASEITYYYFDGNQQTIGTKENGHEENIFNIRDWMQAMGIVYSKKCALSLSKFKSPLFDFTRKIKEEKPREKKCILYTGGCYKNDYSISEVTIKTNKVEKDSFKNCIFLTKIDLSECDEILDGAFENCTSLQEVIFSNKLVRICPNAFKGCSSIERIQFKDGIKEIGASAFYGCTSLKEVQFSKTIENIKEKAFACCKALEKIELPNIKIVSAKVFMDCLSLRTVYLPDCLERIEHEVFAGCEKLENVLWNPECSCSKIIMGAFKDTLFYKNTRLSEESMEVYIGKYLWYSNKRVLRIQPGTLGLDKNSIRNVEELVMPSSLSRLEQSICIHMDSLKKLVFEDGVTTILKDIYGGAFEGCTQLQTIIWPNSLHLVHPDTFKDCPQCTIYATVGSYAQDYAMRSHIPFQENTYEN